MIFSSKL